MSVFHLQIFTPKKIFFNSEDVRAAFFVGSKGEFCILPNHAFFSSILETGRIVFFINEMSEYLFSTGGYLFMQNNQLHVFLESVWYLSDLDLATIECNLQNVTDEAIQELEKKKLDVLKMPDLQY